MAIHYVLKAHNNSIRDAEKRIKNKNERKNIVKIDGSNGLVSYSKSCKCDFELIAIKMSIMRTEVVIPKYMSFGALLNDISFHSKTPSVLVRIGREATLVVKPHVGKSFSRTVPTAELSALFGGAWPNSDTWAVIVEKLKNR